MAVLIFIRHHENIRRLLKGQEPKIGAKKTAEAPPARGRLKTGRGGPSRDAAAAPGCGWPAPRTVGPVAFDQLLDRFGAAAARRWPPCPTWPGARGRAGRSTAARGRGRGRAGPPATALGARLICACEPDFPRLLAALDPPPPLIWARGDAALLHRPAVAVVGARVASAAGQRFARGLAADLGQARLPSWSRAWRAVSTARRTRARCPRARWPCWAAGSTTSTRPSTRGLYARIAEGGASSPKARPATRAMARDFPRRNRMITGLSLGRGGGRGGAPAPAR